MSACDGQFTNNCSRCFEAPEYTLINTLGEKVYSCRFCIKNVPTEFKEDKLMNETQAKHTPGPWRYDQRVIPEDPPIKLSSFAIMADSYCLATTDSNEANANLIAAAPELLEVLRNIYRYNTDAAYRESWKSENAPEDYSPMEYFTDCAEAVIAKAQGGV